MSLTNSDVSTVASAAFLALCMLVGAIVRISNRIQRAQIAHIKRPKQPYVHYVRVRPPVMEPQELAPLQVSDLATAARGPVEPVATRAELPATLLRPMTVEEAESVRALSTQCEQPPATDPQPEPQPLRDPFPAQEKDSGQTPAAEPEPAPTPPAKPEPPLPAWATPEQREKWLIMRKHYQRGEFGTRAQKGPDDFRAPA